MAEQDYIHMPTLEEYAERFKNFFHFKREDGILEVRMHTFDGPGALELPDASRPFRVVDRCRPRHEE